MALNERSMTDVRYYSSGSGQLFMPDNTSQRIKQSELPFELQHMYNKYWWEGLCNCDACLVSVPSKTDVNGIEYGIMLITEFEYDPHGTEAEFESPEWYDGLNMLFEAVEHRINFYKEVLEAAQFDMDVFVGKGTGYNHCHEIGFFVPYDKSERNTLKLLNTVNALVTDSLEDIDEDVRLITDEEMFRRFVTNTKGLRRYASKLFNAKGTEKHNKQGFILIDKETQSILHLRVGKELSEQCEIEDIINIIGIACKIKEKAHEANEKYDFSEIVEWALEEQSNTVWQIESSEILLPSSYSVIIERGSLMAIDIM